MAEKPILFNTQMVRAILAGQKTQTRRLVKVSHRGAAGFNVCFRKSTGEFAGVYDWDDEESMYEDRTPAPCEPGDILWVRETWAKDAGRYMYKANYSDTEKFYMNGREIRMVWSPSIHMPREAARLFLRVTDVRIERLQDIDEEGVCAEGAEKIILHCQHMDWSVVPPEPCYNSRPCANCIIDKSYSELFGEMVWNSTIKPADLPRYGWEANPWVWVIEFERIKRS